MQLLAVKVEFPSGKVRPAFSGRMLIDIADLWRI